MRARNRLDGYVTAGQAAVLEGISRQRVQQLCDDGRAPGALYLSGGKGRGFWMVKLDDGGTPQLDRGFDTGRPAGSKNSPFCPRSRRKRSLAS